MRLSLYAIGFACCLQAPRSVDQERVALPLPIARMCERVLQYLDGDDVVRAHKVLTRLDGYAVAYDRKWQTRTAQLLPKASAEAVRETCHILLYAELLDQLRSIEDTPNPTITATRHALLAAKASYAYLAGTVRANKDGKRRNAILAHQFLDLASTLPHYDTNTAWQEPISAKAAQLRRLLGAALPALDHAVRPQPRTPTQPSTTGTTQPSRAPTSTGSSKESKQ